MESSRPILRVVIAWNAALTLGGIVLAAGWARSPVARFSEISVERIDVVDASGTRRMAITNRDRLPDLVVNGKHGTRSSRSVQPAGIVLYDEHGNEAGGLATTATRDGADQSMLVLDYGAAEAIGLVQRHTATTAMAGLVINEPSPPAAAGAKRPTAITRVALTAADRASSIELSDTQGRPRIRLAVDAADHPSISILDETGAVVGRLPTP